MRTSSVQISLNQSNCTTERAVPSDWSDQHVHADGAHRRRPHAAVQPPGGGAEHRRCHGSPLHPVDAAGPPRC